MSLTNLLCLLANGMLSLPGMGLTKSQMPNTASRATRERLLSVGYQAIPMRVSKSGAFTVQARYGTAKLNLLIDTGSVMSSIDSTTVMRLEISRRETRKVVQVGTDDLTSTCEINPKGLLTLSGIPLKNSDHVADDLSKFNALLKESGEQPINGTLGHRTLRYYSAVIDCPGETLYLLDPMPRLWPLFEGEWKPTRIEMGENRMSDADLNTVSMCFKNHEYKETHDGRTAIKAEVELWPVRESLNRMTLVVPDREVQVYAVYEFLNDTLRVCLVRDPRGLKDTITETMKTEGALLYQLERVRPPAAKPRAEMKRAAAIAPVLGKAGYGSVPMVPTANENNFIVPVELQGNKRNLMLDLGAQLTGLVEKKTKGIELTVVKPGETYGANGERKKCKFCKVSGFKVGDLELKDELIEVSSMSQIERKFDGLFGASTLIRLSAIISYPEAKLYVLDPAKAKAKPKN